MAVGAEVQFPPSTRLELAGWELVWCRVAVVLGGPSPEKSSWGEAHDRFRRRFRDRPLTSETVVGEVRRLFKAAGCDPSRYRPSSEALGRRILRGDDLPLIHPLVDVNNLLSLELLVPCCAVDAEALRPPLVLRRGREGERMLSMRGDFALADKPVLADEEGPFGTPITDSERVKVGSQVSEGWMVTYLPQGHGGADAVETALAAVIQRRPVASVLAVAGVAP